MLNKPGLERYLSYIKDAPFKRLNLSSGARSKLCLSPLNPSLTQACLPKPHLSPDLQSQQASVSVPIIRKRTPSCIFSNNFSAPMITSTTSSFLANQLPLNMEPHQVSPTTLFRSVCFLSHHSGIIFRSADIFPPCTLNYPSSMHLSHCHIRFIVCFSFETKDSLRVGRDVP